MIKAILSLVMIVVGVALIINNFVRISPESDKDSIGIVAHTIDQGLKARNTEFSIQMGAKLINLAMPDGFVDFRDSRIESIEQLYELQSNSISSESALVLMGIDNKVVDFVKTNKGVKPKATKLTMLYEKDSKTSIFTPEILHKIEGAYKNNVLEFNKPSEYTELGVTVIEEELFQEKSEHPLHLMRITKRIIKSNSQEPYLTISCNSIVLVGGKAFHLQVEREYDSPKDVDVVIKVAKDWGDKLLSIN